MTKSPNFKIRLVLMILCTLFTASGQIFFKYSAPHFSLSLSSIFTNYAFLLGLFLYGLGAMLLIMALKYGDLSSIYPLVSLTFIWVIILSAVLFGEVINSFKINAVILVVSGIFLIVGGNHG